VERRDEASVLFADLVGFTRFASQTDPDLVIKVLNDIFNRLDASCAQVGATKIKTTGDGYMAATGVGQDDPLHAERIVELAFEVREAIKKYSQLTGLDLKVRIGIHTGQVIAGIIGNQASHFDVWGDTVNVTSRLESTGVPNEIHVSRTLYIKLFDQFEFESRGRIELRGYGIMST